MYVHLQESEIFLVSWRSGEELPINKMQGVPTSNILVRPTFDDRESMFDVRTLAYFTSADPLLEERFWSAPFPNSSQMNLATTARASQRCNPINALATARRRGSSDQDSSAGAGGDDGSLLEKRSGYGVMFGLFGMVVASAASTALILAHPNWWVFHSPICVVGRAVGLAYYVSGYREKYSSGGISLYVRSLLRSGDRCGDFPAVPYSSAATLVDEPEGFSGSGRRHPLVMVPTD